MKDVIFKVKESSKYIEGQILYQNNEFIFESNSGIGDFSLMLGKGYCELTIAKFNRRVYSFGGVNVKKSWINKKLVFPNSIKGELFFIDKTTQLISGTGIWYIKNWNTYYDEESNYICMGECNVNLNDISVEFCKNIVAIVDKTGLLKSIWIKNIEFR